MFRLIIKVSIVSAVVALMAFAFFGCDKSEDNPAGITGTVSVEGASAAGAVAMLYNQVNTTADVSIWSVPNRSSVVGFEYQTEVGYNFLTVPPLKTDTVGSDGKFSFSDLVQGDFIVVVIKDGFGWTRPRAVTAADKEVNAGTFQLFPETVYDLTVMTENTTWTSGRHYVLTNTFFLNEGVTLTVEPGAVVRLGRNVVMNIRGTMVCNGLPNNFIYFEPAEVENRSPEVWGPLKFWDEASVPVFRYCVFRHADRAIESLTAGGVIEHCYFYRVLSNAILSFNSAPEIRRCMFERSGTSVEARSAENVICEHNVFQTSDPFAIFYDTVTNGDIYCNWFRDCGGSDSAGSGTRGVMGLHWINNFDVSRNFIETSWYALSIGSGVNSSNNIHHNEFTRCNRVMNVGVTEERRSASYPRFNFNCFTSIDLRVITVEACQHNTIEIDATNNFWNTNSVQQIQNAMIVDCHQNASCPCILIEPIELSCPLGVGICTN